MNRYTILAIAGLWAIATTGGAQQTAALPADLQNMDEFITQVRERFDVPGVAVAIVKDGQVVLEQGYGLRNRETGQAADANTLFSIASNTKAFTSASLQMLVDEGKLDMNAPVTDYLPWFAMSDAYVTSQMTVRDLLVHRSGLGLGAGDLLYFPGTDYTTEEVVRRLRHVPLKRSFRQEYAYDNILYGVAQLVIEQVSGQTYQQFLQQRFFTPLGMNNTRFNSDYLQPQDNFAIGYAKAEFKDLQPAITLSWHNLSAAGGVYSSVHDMAQWIKAQLGNGLYTDTQQQEQTLFSERAQQQMWSLVTPLVINEPSVPELAVSKPQFLGYGEGWMLSDYQGHKLVWHTGGWPGMVSRVTLVPGENLGIVVLTNQESGAAFNAITMHLLDAYLGNSEKTDWIAAYGAAVDENQTQADEKWQSYVAARNKRSRPGIALSGYAGTYQDPWYGDITVTHEGGKLMMRFSRSPLLVGEMSHWQYDTFLVKWQDRTLNGDAFVIFSLNMQGKVHEARMLPASSLSDFSFNYEDLLLKPVQE